MAREEPSTVETAKLMLTAKKFQGISNFIISIDLHGFRAPEESLNWKLSSHVLKNIFYRHYKTLQLDYI